MFSTRTVREIPPDQCDTPFHIESFRWITESWVKMKFWKKSLSKLLLFTGLSPSYLDDMRKWLSLKQQTLNRVVVLVELRMVFQTSFRKRTEWFSDHVSRTSRRIFHFLNIISCLPDTMLLVNFREKSSFSSHFANIVYPGFFSRPSISRCLSALAMVSGEDRDSKNLLKIY
jgi:hypothetical protein